MIDLKNILLPTDFSESSLQATHYGVALAKKFGATLHLLYVIEDPVVYLPMFESYPLPSRQQFETYAEDRMENWILDQDREDLNVAYHWAHGRPVAEILRAASELGIGMIVMGTHGSGIARHLLMGSVAEKVVRHASCPVLTVQPEGHQFVHSDNG